MVGFVAFVSVPFSRTFKDMLILICFLCRENKTPTVSQLLYPLGPSLQLPARMLSLHAHLKHLKFNLPTPKLKILNPISQLPLKNDSIIYLPVYIMNLEEQPLSFCLKVVTMFWLLDTSQGLLSSFLLT